MVDAGSIFSKSIAPSGYGKGAWVNVYNLISDSSGNISINTTEQIFGIASHGTVVPGTCDNSFTLNVQDSDMDVADVATVNLYRGTSLPNTKNTFFRMVTATVPVCGIKNTIRFVASGLGATKTVTVKIYYLV